MEGRWYLYTRLFLYQRPKFENKWFERFNFEDHSGGIIAALCFILFYLYIPANKVKNEKAWPL